MNGGGGLDSRKRASSSFFAAASLACSSWVTSLTCEAHEPQLDICISTGAAWTLDASVTMLQNHAQAWTQRKVVHYHLRLLHRMTLESMQYLHILVETNSLESQHWRKPATSFHLDAVFCADRSVIFQLAAKIVPYSD